MVILLTDFFFISLLIPGLLHVNTWTVSNGVVMGTQAAALCIIEQTLYQEDQGKLKYIVIYNNSISNVSILFNYIYKHWWRLSHFKVCVYSLVYVFLILKCRVGAENKLDQNMTWLISCLYLAKLTILFGDISMGIFSTWLLLVTISPLYYFYTSSTMTKQQVRTISVVIVTFSIGISLCTLHWNCCICHKTRTSRQNSLFNHSTRTNRKHFNCLLFNYMGYRLPSSFF